MGKKLRITIVVVLVALVAIQFWPVTRTNPPVTGEVQAPQDVMNVARGSCYDCHSNETEWPWYAYVAPVSWLVAHDVNEGRQHVNFSTWSSLSPKDEGDALEEIREQMEKKEMPLWYYLPLHPDARMSDADRETVIDWTRQRRTELGLPPEGGESGEGRPD